MSKKNRNRQNNFAEEQIDPTQEALDVEETSTEETPEVQEEPVAAEEVPVVDNPVEAEPEVKQEEPAVEEKLVEQVASVAINQPNKELLKVEKKPASKVATVVAASSPAVDQFNKIAQRYVELMTKDVITDDIKKSAIITLTNMANFVCMSGEPAVFEACYQFMLKNRNIMLVPETVVDGINRFLAKDKIAKVVQFYVTFQSLVESKLLHTKFTLNVTTIGRVLANDQLKNWLITKR